MAHDDEPELVPLKVRTFRMDDYPRVRAVWKGSGLEIRPGDSRKEIGLKVKRDPEFFLVGEVDGRIVASVIGAWDGRRAYIYHLGVLPAFQRLGVASQLVREVERRMKAKGVVKVNASIYRWNMKSLAFFRANGYETDTNTVHVGKYFEQERKTRQSSRR